MKTILALLLLSAAAAAGDYHVVKYDPSSKPHELQFAVDYTLWVPSTDKPLRGVIVHQHGCGAGACKSGETAAYDLHWQALAAKWNCALLGPRYHQEDGENCRLWCDPRNGSRTAFLKCLDEFAVKAKRPELKTVPWCLWGHSGGGMWSSIMMASDPDRIAAVWLRSGTAFGRDEKEFAKVDYPDAAYKIPVMVNPGAKEKGDMRFGSLYDACEKMHKHFRGNNAPFAFAADPNTGHECGDSRYLAIPWFDACLAVELPQKPGDPLTRFCSRSGRVVDNNWLPNEDLVKAHGEYIKTGLVSDATPPSAPTNLKVAAGENDTVLTWDAAADFESGLAGFIIERDGKEIARVTGKAAKGDRPLFQGRTYHDTPDASLPKMTFTEKTTTKDSPSQYRVIAVNGAGLKSHEPRP